MYSFRLAPTSCDLVMCYVVQLLVHEGLLYLMYPLVYVRRWLSHMLVLQPVVYVRELMVHVVAMHK